MKNPDDFFAIEQRFEQLYEEGRQLFLNGKHEAALDRFKRIFEDSAVFRDVEEIVLDFYSKPKHEWLAKYQERFKT
jgi:hypothetical protein